MPAFSFERINRNHEGLELMSNRDHDRNSNQNPRSGSANPGQQMNKEGSGGCHKPGQQSQGGPKTAQQGGADLGKDPKRQDATKR
ncbi:MAG TPA: hypothetical protein VN665_00590 [Candidatus Paceibacterota bacterium]|nr:hypothetical protein [Candidatus Paceibacterota bacterium]